MLSLILQPVATDLISTNDVCCSADRNCVPVSADDDTSGNTESGPCNPFLSCTSCIGFCALQPLLELSGYRLHDRLLCSMKLPTVISPPLDVWQPPKIG